MEKEKRIYSFYLRMQLPSQKELYCDYNRDKLEIIKEAVEKLDKVEVRKGNFWAIGNIKASENYIYFIFGKLRKKRHTKYNENNKIFSDESFDEALTNEILIAKIQKISKNVDCYGFLAKGKGISVKEKTIIKYFIKFLNSYDEIRKCNIEFSASIIFEEETFFSAIDKSEAIKKLSIDYKRPNPLDQGELLRNLEEAVLEMDGKGGKLSFQGDSLRKKKVKEYAGKAKEFGDKVTISAIIDGVRRIISIDEMPLIIKLRGNLENAIDHVIKKLEKYISK